MRLIALLLACFAALAVPTAAAAATLEAAEPAAGESQGAVRFVSPAVERAEAQAIARFGPFRVLDGRTAALVDVTDADSPRHFRAMLGAYPDLATLRFIECPGTFEDRANLRLGRMIRAAGLVAEVPADGSVRSGAVELVLAGAELRIDDRAEFAVHAWQDENGREAYDYAPEAEENAKYLAYYREMGMDDREAAAFYAMTNSVPFEEARWLTGQEMRRWMAGEAAAPALAYLDLELRVD